MNTQQLESFVQVAEHLNFARAAEALNITQSAVSRQIRSLEEELGTKLLHRSTRTVALTPAGITFLNDAKEILFKLKLSAQKLKNQSNENIQILTIGCINEVYLPFLTDLLQEFREQFPEVHPFIRSAPFRSILNLFIHDEIDILFGFKDDIPIQEGFCYRELTQMPVCYAMHTEHPFATKKELTVQEVLTDHIIICNSFELPTRISNIQAQLAHNFTPDAMNYCENLRTMLALIQAGYGIGILPEIPSTGRNIAYVPIEQHISLSFGMFYKYPSRNPVAEKFLSLTDY